MSTKRRQHSSEFKAKVAIAAIKNNLTTSHICSKYQISPSCLFKWKKELLEQAGTIFSDKNSKKSSELILEQKEIDNLYAEIGKLKIAKDFLEKKLKSWI